MRKRLVWTSLLCAGIAGTAHAHTLTREGAECLMNAMSLAKSAREKSLPDASLDKIQALLMKFGGHCEAKQYDEAAAVAKDIRAVIDSK